MITPINTGRHGLHAGDCSDDACIVGLIGRADRDTRPRECPGQRSRLCSGQRGSVSGSDHDHAGSSGQPRYRQFDPRQSSGTRRILIVDDSPPDVSTMERYLDDMENVRIMSASEAHEADALLQHEYFDVILLDYRMPGRTGLDYLKVIRRRDPDVGVIMVTAFSDETIAIESIRRRVDDFLRKEDMTQEMLIDSVDRLLVHVKRRRSAPLDSITGLYCSRSLRQRLSEACTRLKDHGDKFSVLMINLLAFKRINEQYSHATGDRVLRRIAGILPEVLRAGDFAARYQDDKFCIVAPETEEHKVETLVKRLRECILRLEFDYGEGRFGLDCVIGVAHFKDDVPDSVQAVIDTAYMAMQNSRG